MSYNFLVMDQGDIGDCMYIIYTGECGVYIFKSEHDGFSGSHKAVAILGANTAVTLSLSDPSRKQDFPST